MSKKINIMPTIPEKDECEQFDSFTAMIERFTITHASDNNKRFHLRKIINQIGKFEEKSKKLKC
jgi:hypothetical protein